GFWTPSSAKCRRCNGTPDWRRAMMQQATQCPDQAVLAEHLRGSLAAEAERSVLAHLDHCETCQKMLEVLGARDTRLLRVARHAGDESPPSDAGLGALIGKLTALRDSPATGSWPTADVLPTFAPEEQSGELGRLGHYTILGEIGQGGMGVVFKAFDQSLQ